MIMLIMFIHILYRYPVVIFAFVSLRVCQTIYFVNIIIYFSTKWISIDLPCTLLSSVIVLVRFSFKTKILYAYAAEFSVSRERGKKNLMIF